MRLLKNTKAVSTFIILLLILIAAIVGGLLSYMFTIAPFIKMPNETTLATSVYFDKENATALTVNVLNPSYSPIDATVTGIVLILENVSQSYEAIETNPSITNGVVVTKGTSLNITCFKFWKDNVNYTWGRLAGDFAGRIITVSIFAINAQAPNTHVKVPFVRLNILHADFNSKVSFKTFNVTVQNDVKSESNLTVSEILVPGINLTENKIIPSLPQSITNGTSSQFTCNASWNSVTKAILWIYTKEGYAFYKNLTLPGVYTAIDSIVFNENYTNHFNVTVSNFAESANFVNVTKITCTLENGTKIDRNYPSVGIKPNATYTFKFDFNWSSSEYRGKKINVKASFLQDFETSMSASAFPSPIIVKVLNEKQVFDLKDRTHFNITLQNRFLSFEAINITKIVVKETQETINSTKANPQLPYGPLAPNQAVSLYCNISDWKSRAGENLTLIVHTLTNKTSKEYTFEFTFALPAAELNITNVFHAPIGGTDYLNILIESSQYSVWNLTVSKVTITLPSQTTPINQTFSKNQIIIKPGNTTLLLIAADWQNHLGENITITVTTVEGIEASWQGTLT